MRDYGGQDGVACGAVIATRGLVAMERVKGGGAVAMERVKGGGAVAMESVKKGGAVAMQWRE
jgi:hypothetical protein